MGSSSSCTGGDCLGQPYGAPISTLKPKLVVISSLILSISNRTLSFPSSDNISSAISRNLKPLIFCHTRRPIKRIEPLFRNLAEYLRFALLTVERREAMPNLTKKLRTQKATGKVQVQGERIKDSVSLGMCCRVL